MNIVSSLSMYPLQVSYRDIHWPQPTGTQVLIFFAVVGAVIFLLVLLSALRKSQKFSFLNENYQPRQDNRRGFSVFTMHRIANNLGLSRDQAKMLEFVLRNDGVSDPARSMNSPHLLDRHFKRAYRSVERTSISDEELNSRLSVLFSIRNIIEANMGTVTTTSTRQIPDNAAAILAIGDKNYPIRVISSRGDSLVVENPTDINGNPLHLARGSKVSLSFFTQSNKGFSVESRVLESSTSPNGPILQLVHSGQIKKLSHRRYRRRQTVFSTAFYHVRVEEGVRKKDKRMVVERQRYSGSILDISIGGCSIKTTALVSAGKRIKIEFTREDNSVVVALGEILRTNRAGINTIMHVRFLKVPRKSLNSINAMVYEYAD